jgi:ABC-type uncharacterized transport system permease subunit
VLHLLAFLFYVGALLLWIRLLWKGSPGVRGPGQAPLVLGAGVITHAVALAAFWFTFRELPLTGPGAALSTLAFVGGLTLLAILPMREMSRVGIALLPFIVICLGAALLVGIHPSGAPLTFQGPGFVLHVAFAFLGYQGLALAAAAGSLYLVQHWELKAKRLGRFYHFIPPLATLDLLARIGLYVGFPALTMALALGWSWVSRNPAAVGLGDPKVLWAATSWVIFALVLLARVGRGRGEYRGALAAVVGFTLVLGSFLVLRFSAQGGGLLQ